MIDIGINFTDKAFSKDLSECISAAHSADVTQMIVTGTDIEGSQQAAQLAAAHPDSLFSTAGVHPHHAKDWRPEDYETLKKLAQSDNVIAIGEAGLDFNRDFSPRNQQEAVFQFQIHLAIELSLPLFLHERDAHKRQRMILQEYSNDLPNTVIHCFTGDKTALFNYLDLGCYIGITGWVCDERRGKELQTLVKQIPKDRLMIETDGPYLLPRNIKPKPKSRRNEPKYLCHIANTIAQLRGETTETFISQTTNNTKRFFSI